MDDDRSYRNVLMVFPAEYKGMKIIDVAADDAGLRFLDRVVDDIKLVHVREAVGQLLAEPEMKVRLDALLGD